MKRRGVSVPSVNEPKGPVVGVSPWIMTISLEEYGVCSAFRVTEMFSGISETMFQRLNALLNT